MALAGLQEQKTDWTQRQTLPVQSGLEAQEPATPGLSLAAQPWEVAGRTLAEIPFPPPTATSTAATKLWVFAPFWSPEVASPSGVMLSTPVAVPPCLSVTATTRSTSHPAALGTAIAPLCLESPKLTSGSQIGDLPSQVTVSFPGHHFSSWIAVQP